MKNWNERIPEAELARVAEDIDEALHGLALWDESRVKFKIGDVMMSVSVYTVEDEWEDI